MCVYSRERERQRKEKKMRERENRWYHKTETRCETDGGKKRRGTYRARHKLRLWLWAHH